MCLKGQVDGRVVTAVVAVPRRVGRRVVAVVVAVAARVVPVVVVAAAVRMFFGGLERRRRAAHARVDKHRVEYFLLLRGRFFFAKYLLRIRYDAATAVLGEAVGDAAGALALVAAHLGSSVRRCVGRAA